MIPEVRPPTIGTPRPFRWAGSSVWSEHRTFNPSVQGSNPCRLTPLHRITTLLPSFESAFESGHETPFCLRCADILTEQRPITSLARDPGGSSSRPAIPTPTPLTFSRAAPSDLRFLGRCEGLNASPRTVKSSCTSGAYGLNTCPRMLPRLAGARNITKRILSNILSLVLHLKVTARLFVGSRCRLLLQAEEYAARPQTLCKAREEPT